MTVESSHIDPPSSEASPGVNDTVRAEDAEALSFSTEPHSPLGMFVRRFRQNRGAVAATAVLGLLVLTAIFGPWISPHDPNAQNLSNAFLAPLSDNHLLGTDELGRDSLSRVISGSRITVLAVGQSLLIAMAIGVPFGLLSGYFGGLIDLLIMRMADAIQSFPPLVLAIAIVGILGPSLRNSMLAVGLVFSPNFTRIVRASVLEIREHTFIEASKSIGSPTSFIMLRRVVPNILPPVLVQVSLMAGFALLAEASLSFLGLGVQLPQASWGSMLSRGYQYLYQQPWMILPPGAAIVITVLCFNVVGDGMRDAIGKEIRRG